MKNLLKIFLVTMGLLSVPALACDQNEADNMCSPSQIFDPSSGECKDTSV